MKFRKKPIIVDAVQWFPNKKVAGVKMINQSLSIIINKKINNKIPVIKTLEGNHLVSAGDWIITGVNGEKYPCKPDIFKKTYEKVK
jgi:hypothetical protein